MKQGLERKFDEKLKEIRKYEKEMKKMESKYNNDVVISNGIKIYGLSGFALNRTKEESDKYDELYEKTLILREELGNLLHELASYNL